MASIAVVGGGLAGLACAWRLVRAGHDVEVLERGDAPGGRARRVPQGDFAIDRGAATFQSGDRTVHEMAAALGLAPRPLARSHDAIIRDGCPYPVDSGDPLTWVRSGPLGRLARMRLLGLAPALLRHARRFDPAHPERVSALDGEALGEGIRRLAGAEALDFLLEPLFGAEYDADPEDVSLAFGLQMLRQHLRGATPHTFDGGLGALAARMATPLRVRTGCTVFSVETETDGARVRYRTAGRTSSLLADAAVVALPAPLIPACCPKLTPAERGFLEGVRYAAGATVHLLFDRAPRNLGWRMLALPRCEGFEVRAAVAAHHRPGVAPHGAGLASISLRPETAARLWKAPDAVLADCALENLAYTPVGRLHPRGFAVDRWPQLRPLFAPGHIGRLGRFERRSDRSPRLAFAGDWAVAPSVEGALASGLRAATEISATL